MVRSAGTTVRALECRAGAVGGVEQDIMVPCDDELVGMRQGSEPCELGLEFRGGAVDG